MRTLASISESNCWPFKSSSRRRPLKLSIPAFGQGRQVDEHRARAVEAATVGHGIGDELGLVVGANVGRGAALGRQTLETATTPSASMDSSTSVARASRVYSSITFKSVIDLAV
jgi:hypothetical protein